MARWRSFLMLLGTFAVQSYVSVTAYDKCNASSSTTCCLCKSENCNKPLTCLDGFYKVQNESLYQCSGPVESTTQSPEMTTEPQNSTASNDPTIVPTSAATSKTPEISTTADEDETIPDTVCVKCNSECPGNCTGPEVSDCVKCKFEYNRKCYEECPAKTRPDNSTITDEGNTTRCVDVPDEKENSLPWIIGGGAGGGVVLIVVVVVIVVVVCRRRQGSDSLRNGQTKSERTAMSQIIEDRNEGCKPQRPPPVTPDTMGNAPTTGGSTLGTSRRPDYTNIKTPGEGFGLQIQQQTDNVLRYTKDPTEKTKKKTQPRDKVVSQEIYANDAMVRLQDKMDLTKESLENISHMLDKVEVDALPEAPKPPSAGVQTPKKKPQGKPGIIKRLSQRMSRKTQGKKAIKGQLVDTVGDDYIDMSGSEVTQEEEYENVNVGPGTAVKNKSTAAATGGRKPVKAVGSQPRGKAVASKQGKTVTQSAPKQGKTVTQSAVKKEVGGGEDIELEDYENAPEKREKFAKEEEIEVYENTGAATQKPDTGEEMEDYENVEKPLVDTGGMEDYEPVEINAQVEENPYMNVQYGKKK